METKQDSEKSRLWQERIREQKASGQTKAAFCKEHGLSRFQFDYWVKRIKSKPGSGHIKKPLQASSFIKAEVLPIPSRSCVGSLDAKWVAEFILHLQGGVR